MAAHADAAHADAAPATMRSKTLATWVAVLGGFFGLHRFYLRGLKVSENCFAPTFLPTR